MAKATHRNYKHPRHLRVEDDGKVLCYSPSCSDYPKLFKDSLPDYNLLSAEQVEALRS